MAAFGMLKKGGIGVIKFLLLAVLMCAIQDAIGGIGAKLFGLDARIGLAMGSIPLVGGHGTAGSFGPFLEGLGLSLIHIYAGACEAGDTASGQFPRGQ